MLNKEKYLEKYCEKELELEERDECIAEKVIFSCSTEDEKEEIIVKFKELSEDKVREAFEIKEEEECNIEFDEAPEPKEINWEHINYPDHHRLGRQIIGWLLTSLFLASITVVFFFVLSESQSSSSNPSQNPSIACLRLLPPPPTQAQTVLTTASTRRPSSWSTWP